MNLTIATSQVRAGECPSQAHSRGFSNSRQTYDPIAPNLRPICMGSRLGQEQMLGLQMSLPSGILFKTRWKFTRCGLAHRQKGRSSHVWRWSSWHRPVQNCWREHLWMASELENRRDPAHAATLL